MESTTETNKLIAAFMGYKLITPEMRTVPSDWTTSYWQKDYPQRQDVLASEKQEMGYHKSWDWLMPVVEKIESLPFRFEIGKHSVYIFHTNNYEDVVYVDADVYETKIEAVYHVVVKFIQWYNTQNNS